MPTHKKGAPKLWTDERIDALEIKYCLEGKDFPTCAKELGVTHAAAKTQVRILGFVRTLQGRSAAAKNLKAYRVARSVRGRREAS